jgi:RNA polymerase sigma-70 factor (ECF subfamily)
MGALDTDHVAAALEANAADLLGYFYRRLDEPEDAADLLAETALVLWRKANSLPGDGTAARMWMFGIARKVLSSHRRTTRRRSALQDKLREELAAAPTNAAVEQDLDVRAALSTLARLDQEIIRLTYWDGFTQKQAAELLGIPEGTVRSRHHRARATLRRTLSTDSDISMPR